MSTKNAYQGYVLVERGADIQVVSTNTFIDSKDKVEWEGGHRLCHALSIAGEERATVVGKCRQDRRSLEPAQHFQKSLH